jgi:DHA2 family multidrug resistance protein
MMAVFGMSLFGVIALQPLMLERLFDYPAQTTGLVMAPRGLASAFGMFLVSRLIRRHGPVRLIFAGLLLAATGTCVMTSYNLALGPAWFVWPSLLQGMGMGMIFVPLSTVAYASLPSAATDHGAAIFNLARTVGSSLGISIAATVFTHMAQVNWNRLGGHIDVFNPALQHWLAAQHLSLQNPLAPQRLAAELGRQASMLGFIDAFQFITWSFLVLAPLLLMLRRSRARATRGGNDTPGEP